MYKILAMVFVLFFTGYANAQNTNKLDVYPGSDGKQGRIQFKGTGTTAPASPTGSDVNIFQRNGKMLCKDSTGADCWGITTPGGSDINLNTVIPVTLQSYGCVGDGVTNNTTCLTNALNDLSGQTIVCTAGTYNFNTAITITNVTGGTLIGPGVGTSAGCILNYTGGAGYAINITQARDMLWDGIYLSTNGKSGINLSPTAGTGVIINNRFRIKLNSGSSSPTIGTIGFNFYNNPTGPPYSSNYFNTIYQSEIDGFDTLVKLTGIANGNFMLQNTYRHFNVAALDIQTNENNIIGGFITDCTAGCVGIKMSGSSAFYNIVSNISMDPINTCTAYNLDASTFENKIDLVTNCSNANVDSGTRNTITDRFRTHHAGTFRVWGDLSGNDTVFWRNIPTMTWESTAGALRARINVDQSTGDTRIGSTGKLYLHGGNDYTNPVIGVDGGNGFDIFSFSGGANSFPLRFYNGTTFLAGARANGSSGDWSFIGGKNGSFSAPSLVLTSAGGRLVDTSNGQGLVVSPNSAAVTTYLYLYSLAFANLGSPSNGGLVYCSDCQQANPCASGGSGAVARREAGAWNCAGSGGGGGSYTFNSGTGTTASTVGTTITYGVDTAVVPTFLQGTATIDFGSIAANACSTSTITVTGAVTGDGVQPSWPSTLEAGLLGMMHVTASNTVTVTLCKITAGSVDPASNTFGATVVKHFQLIKNNA